MERIKSISQVYPRVSLYSVFYNPYKHSNIISEHMNYCWKATISFLNRAFLVGEKYLIKNFSARLFHESIVPGAKVFNHDLASSLNEYGNKLSLITSLSTPWNRNESLTPKDDFRGRWGSSNSSPWNCPMVCNIWNITGFSSNVVACISGLIMHGFSSSTAGCAYARIALSLSSAKWMALAVNSLLISHHHWIFKLPIQLGHLLYILFCHFLFLPQLSSKGSLFRDQK